MAKPSTNFYIISNYEFYMAVYMISETEFQKTGVAEVLYSGNVSNNNC